MILALWSPAIYSRNMMEDFYQYIKAKECDANEPELRLTGLQFGSLQGEPPIDTLCFCYGWWRNEHDYLYIGKTIVGISRLKYNHHVLFHYGPVEPFDWIHFWPSTEIDVLPLERKLIRLFNPYYNNKLRKDLE